MCSVFAASGEELKNIRAHRGHEVVLDTQIDWNRAVQLICEMQIAYALCQGSVP